MFGGGTHVRSYNSQRGIRLLDFTPLPRPTPSVLPIAITTTTTSSSSTTTATTTSNGVFVRLPAGKSAAATAPPGVLRHRRRNGTAEKRGKGNNNHKSVSFDSRIKIYYFVQKDPLVTSKQRKQRSYDLGIRSIW
jgi:hypothetical protein